MIPQVNDALREATPLAVLYLTPTYMSEAGGGLGAHVLDLALGMGELCGTRIDILTHSAEQYTRTLRPGVTVHAVSSGGAPSSTWTAQSLQAMNEALHDYGQALLDGAARRPNIVHCQDKLVFPAAKALAQQFGIPLIGAVHLLQSVGAWWGEPLDPANPVEAAIQAQERALCQTADYVITVSDAMRDIIQQRYSTPTERIAVIYNGIDTGRFAKRAQPDAQAAFRATFAAPDEPIVLFVGRLEQRKGALPLLESAAEVLRHHPRARYLLAGGAAMREPMQTFQRIARLRRAHPIAWQRIKLLGQQPRERLTALYQAADLVVVPSLHEPFGLVAVEAMAAAVPVIVTAAEGLAEIVRHEATGLVVPLGEDNAGGRVIDVAVLAAAQQRLLADQPLAARLAQAGQRDAIARFGLVRAVERMAQVYAHVLAAPAWSG